MQLTGFVIAKRLKKTESLSISGKASRATYWIRPPRRTVTPFLNNSETGYFPEKIPALTGFQLLLSLHCF